MVLPTPRLAPAACLLLALGLLARASGSATTGAPLALAPEPPPALSASALPASALPVSALPASALPAPGLEAPHQPQDQPGPPAEPRVTAAGAPAAPPAASQAALSALVVGDDAGLPIGRPTPLAQAEMGPLLAEAHRELYKAPPGPERLLIAWAHAAHETSRGEGCIDNNLGNIVVSLRWKGGWHLRRVLEQSRFGPERWVTQRVRFRSYPTALDGARDYWRVIGGNFGSALPYFDTGDAAGAGRQLCQRGYSTAPCEAYSQGIKGLYGELRSTYAASLKSILRGTK